VRELRLSGHGGKSGRSKWRLIAQQNYSRIFFDSVYPTQT
jgi:hypothetical protein